MIRWMIGIVTITITGSILYFEQGIEAMRR